MVLICVGRMAHRHLQQSEILKFILDLLFQIHEFINIIPENGRNNALRINGLGAPRAFYTPLLRKLNLPNTSYGEDYALGLRISREYPIGRIYDVLYLCRRWEDNSDASLDVVKMNNHNIYKDKIRTWELEARLNMERQ